MHLVLIVCLPFSLAEELCCKLLDSLPNTKASPHGGMPSKTDERKRKALKFLKFNEGTGHAKGMLAWLACSFRLTQDNRILHKNLEGAVDGFLELFEERYRRRHESKANLGGIALNYAVCLSSLLGCNIAL